MADLLNISKITILKNWCTESFLNEKDFLMDENVTVAESLLKDSSEGKKIVKAIFEDVLFQDEKINLLSVEVSHYINKEFNFYIKSN